MLSQERSGEPAEERKARVPLGCEFPPKVASHLLSPQPSNDQRHWSRMGDPGPLGAKACFWRV